MSPFAATRLNLLSLATLLLYAFTGPLTADDVGLRAGLPHGLSPQFARASTKAKLFNRSIPSDIGYRILSNSWNEIAKHGVSRKQEKLCLHSPPPSTA